MDKEVKEDDLGVELEEEENLDDNGEEILVQAAFDSSPKGFPTAGGSAVRATIGRTACPPWSSPIACLSQAVKSLGEPGRFCSFVSASVTSAPSPLKIPVSERTWLSPPTATLRLDSFHADLLNSVNTWRGAVPSMTSFSLLLVPQVLKLGTEGSTRKIDSLLRSRWSASSVRNAEIRGN